MNGFRLKFTPEADRALAELESNPAQTARLKKVRKCLAWLEVNPRHPGLQSHPYESLQAGNGEPIWESYVENKTPGAWRVWWYYGPERGEITVMTIDKHPS